MSVDDGGLTPELLKAAEEQLGMTQEQMAAAGGIHVKTYRNWASGRHPPSRNKRGQLMQFLRDSGVVELETAIAVDVPRVTGMRKAAMAALAHVPDELLLDAIRALDDIAEHGTQGGSDGG